MGELDPEHYPVRYGGEVTDFDVDRLMKKHCEVRLEKSVQMGLVAAQEALEQAALLDDDQRVSNELPPVTTLMGSGHGPYHETEIQYAAYFARGPRVVRPSTISKAMFNCLSSHSSIHFGLTGANFVSGFLVLVGDCSHRAGGALDSAWLRRHRALWRRGGALYARLVHRMDSHACSGAARRSQTGVAAL